MGAFAQQPGIILINGKVITVDAKDSTAQTIAISSAKILAVGTNETVRDLHGRTATTRPDRHLAEQKSETSTIFLHL